MAISASQAIGTIQKGNSAIGFGICNVFARNGSKLHNITGNSTTRRLIMQATCAGAFNFCLSMEWMEGRIFLCPQFSLLPPVYLTRWWISRDILSESEMKFILLRELLA